MRVARVARAVRAGHSKCGTPRPQVSHRPWKANTHGWASSARWRSGGRLRSAREHARGNTELGQPRSIGRLGPRWPPRPCTGPWFSTVAAGRAGRTAVGGAGGAIGGGGRGDGLDVGAAVEAREDDGGEQHARHEREEHRHPPPPDPRNDASEVAGQRGPSGCVAEAGRTSGQPEARLGAARGLRSAGWPRSLCRLILTSAWLLQRALSVAQVLVRVIRPMHVLVVHAGHPPAEGRAG